MINLSAQLISSQSLNLGGRRGTTDDVATMPFHPSLSFAALRESLNPIPVHSLMLSSNLFLTLEASEMFFSLHMIFSLERAAVVWAILERISGFDSLLEMIAPRYLKFSTSSSL